MGRNTSFTIREAQADEIESLIPLLLLAEESERALRWGLAHLVDSVYCMDDGDQLVGAATMRWRDDPCEIGEALRRLADRAGATARQAPDARGHRQCQH